jgi:hypothetical protein
MNRILMSFVEKPIYEGYAGWKKMMEFFLAINYFVGFYSMFCLPFQIISSVTGSLKYSSIMPILNH